ncbi:MAG: FHA domain-containing protein [Verrucomicrobiota bacterium]
MEGVQKIVLQLPEGTSLKFGLEMDRVRIGRAPDNDVVLDDGSISNHHAELVVSESGCVLKDLHSTNGISKGGLEQAEILLQDLDIVKIGSVRMQLLAPGSEATLFDQPDTDPPLQPMAVVEQAEPEEEKEAGGSSLVTTLTSILVVIALAIGVALALLYFIDRSQKGG